MFKTNLSIKFAHSQKVLILFNCKQSANCNDHWTMAQCYSWVSCWSAVQLNRRTFPSVSKIRIWISTEGNVNSATRHDRIYHYNFNCISTYRVLASVSFQQPFVCRCEKYALVSDLSPALRVNAAVAHYNGIGANLFCASLINFAPGFHYETSIFLICNAFCLNNFFLEYIM